MKTSALTAQNIMVDKVFGEKNKTEIKIEDADNSNPFIVIGQEEINNIQEL